MHRHGDGLLIVACLVVGLVMVAAQGGHHPALFSGAWCGTRSVSATYVLHMAELEIRHLAARIGRIVTVS